MLYLISFSFVITNYIKLSLIWYKDFPLFDNFDYIEFTI